MRWAELTPPKLKPLPDDYPQSQRYYVDLIRKRDEALPHLSNAYGGHFKQVARMK
jgi:hypothetical protein